MKLFSFTLVQLYKISCYTPLFVLANLLYIPAHSKASGSTLSVGQGSTKSVDLETSAGRIIVGASIRGPKIPESGWRTHRISILPWACCLWAQWGRWDSTGALGSSLANKVSSKFMYFPGIYLLLVCVLHLFPDKRICFTYALFNWKWIVTYHGVLLV